MERAHCVRDSSRGIGSSRGSINGYRWFAGDIAAKGIDVLQPFSTVFFALWRTILQNVIVFGLAFSAMLYLRCLGAGTIFFRFAVRRS